MTLHEEIAELIRLRVTHAMAQADGNKSEAARLLGIDRRSLYRFLGAEKPRARGRRS